MINLVEGNVFRLCRSETTGCIHLMSLKFTVVYFYFMKVFDNTTV